MAAWMWIVAGPNGAGKSSFAGKTLENLIDAHPSEFGPGTLTKLNADERTLELRRLHPDAAQRDLNLQAAKDIDATVAAMIDAGQSFVVETVLSSPKYRNDVEMAQSKGMHFGLIYVSLHPPERVPERVSERVAKGGHDVDPATAIARYHRSHEQLHWFAPRADFLRVYDNSDNDPDLPPVVLASRLPGRPIRLLRPGLNPAIDKALAGLARATPRPGYEPG